MTFLDTSLCSISGKGVRLPVLQQMVTDLAKFADLTPSCLRSQTQPKANILHTILLHNYVRYLSHLISGFCCKEITEVIFTQI